MKALAVMLLGLAATVSAFGTDASDRPAGVDARNWIAISPTVGFVVIIDKGGAPMVVPPGRGAGGAALVPPLNGYFMAKTAAGWQRLVVVEPVKGPGVAG